MCKTSICITLVDIYIHERDSWDHYISSTIVGPVMSDSSLQATSSYRKSQLSERHKWATTTLKGNKSHCFGDVGLTELIKSNNFQHFIFNVSSLPDFFRTHNHRKSMDYAILEREWRSVVNWDDMNCA